ncbi:MAG: COG4315 family predicted lipoprotein [Acidimicrobiales bacterium]
MISHHPRRTEHRLAEHDRAGRAAARVTAIGLGLLLVVALSSCSSSTSSPSGSSSATGPSTTTTSAGGPAGTGSTLASIPSGTATVDVGSTDLGQVLVDLTGHTLYVFAADTNGSPTCVDESCTKVWPPLTGSGIAVGNGVPAQPGEFKLVARPDGANQLTVNGQPLYTYSGDAGPGETNGQSVGGQWFVVGVDGQAIRG